jgi:hypothetical protein
MSRRGLHGSSKCQFAYFFCPVGTSIQRCNVNDKFLNTNIRFSPNRTILQMKNYLIENLNVN